MKKRTLLGILMGYLFLGCNNKPTFKKPDLEIVSSGPKYKIEKSKIQKKYSVVEKEINRFVSVDQFKRKVILKQILEEGPIVFVGILYGCPCNERAQPIINNLASKYKDKVTFIGLMPGQKKNLIEYSQKTECIHPVILDKKLTMITVLEILSSGFIVLVGKNTQTLKVWPGYSTNVLKELNQDLSELTNTNFTPFDSQYAPSEITCGCPYTKDF